MNLLILSGSLGRDPERKTFQNGSVVTFSLAETVIGANGEKKAVWHDCEAWSKAGDKVERWCQKGTAVTVTGQLKYDEYTSKEGHPVKRAKMNVFSVEIHARWREHSNGESSQQQAQQSDYNGRETEDGLPF